MKTEISSKNLRNNKFRFTNGEQDIVPYKINSKLSVPFSTIIRKIYSNDIYSGEESIPFEKRDSLYKNILRKEFSDAIKEFNNTIDKLRKEI